MWRYLPLVSLFVLFSCQDKVICPAFQSTYILDDSTRNAYYSYVWQLDEVTRAKYFAESANTGGDSLGVVAQPKTDYYAYAGEKVVPWRVRKRTKYGIVKYEPYWLKKYRMRTAPMENIFAPEPLETNFVASDFSDSLTLDSLSIASVDSASLDSLVKEPVALAKEEKDEVRYRFKYDPNDNFNVEQEYYNKYFGEQFIDKRPKIEPAIQQIDSVSTDFPDSFQTKEPFFKGLFKKKEVPIDTTQLVEEEIPEDLGN